MQAVLSNFADYLQRTTTWLFLTITYFAGYSMTGGLLHYLLGAMALLLIFTPVHAVLASLLPAVIQQDLAGG